MKAYCKLGYMEFLRNLGINLIIILELVLVLMSVIFTVSSVKSQLRYYIPLSDMLNSDGFYATPQMSIGGVKVENFLTSEKDIKEKYPQTKDVIAPTTFGANLRKSENISYEFRGIGYDSAIIENFKPILVSGKWLDSIDKDANTLHLVVSKNYNSITTGDKFELTVGETGKTLKVEIIGELMDGAVIFKRPQKLSDVTKIDSCFINYKISDEENNPPIVIASQEELDKLEIYSYIDKCAFVSLKDKATNEEKEELENALELAGGCKDMDDIKQNSLVDVRKDLIFLTPIVFGVLIFTIVTIICMSAINAKKQLRSYGIYYTCGSRWRQCIMISAFSSLITEVIACILSALVLVLAQSFGLLAETVIEFGLWQAVACAAVLVLNLITSVIMPIIIIGKTQPREIIKSNE